MCTDHVYVPLPPTPAAFSKIARYLSDKNVYICTNEISVLCLQNCLKYKVEALTIHRVICFTVLDPFLASFLPLTYSSLLWK